MKILKILCMLLFIIILAGCKTLITGDANGDGFIDILDCTAIRFHYEGYELLTGDAINRADVNRDGIIDRKDYDLVCQIILS
jgi:hypothetical protein